MHIYEATCSYTYVGVCVLRACVARTHTNVTYVCIKKKCISTRMNIYVCIYMKLDVAQLYICICVCVCVCVRARARACVT
jgi:hypothetical protein